MPGTLRLHIDQFNETAKTWADSSGNGYHATSTNAPSLTTQNGLAVAEFVKSQSDEMTTLPLPPPNGSMTMLFVGYLPPTTDNQYGGVMVMRDGAEGLGGGLYITETGGISYLWGGIYDVIKLSRSNEIALYAVTITPTEAKLYRVDSTGTTVLTNSAAHPALSYSQNRPLYLNNNTFGNYRADFKARFFEYYQNLILTQTDLESIYQFLVSDDIRPSDVAGLTAIGLSANQINLTWNAATDNIGVTEYRIERATNESFTQNLVSLDTGSTATTRSITGLAADTRYYFRVKAKDAVGNLSANWSNTATAATKPDFLLFPLEMTKLSQSPEYFTTITEGKSGREQRNANWDAPLRTYNAMFAVKNQHDIDVIIAFFHAVKGRFKEFYLKDWTEYKYDFTACAEGGNGSRTEFQMSKTYTDVLGNITRRNIKKPRKGTVAVKVGGTLQTEGTHYTVNYATGKITFNSAPANGAVIEQKCEFYVPVRFDTDKMPPAELFLHWINASEAERALYNLADMPMVEVR